MPASQQQQFTNPLERLSGTQKKWATVLVMALLAATNIVWPYNVKQHLPEWFFTPFLGMLTLQNVLAIALLYCAYWVIARKLD